MSHNESERVITQLKELIEKSHMAQAETTSRMWGDIKKLQENQENIVLKGEEFHNYVREQFNSLKIRAVAWDITNKIVWGIVSLILTAVLGAMVGLVIL